MGVRLVEARGLVERVGLLAAVEPHLEEEIDQLSDLALVDVLLGAVGGRGEVVVEIAAEIELALGGVTHHLARLADVVGERLLAEDVLIGRQGFHGGLEMPAPVLVAAGADVDNVQVGLMAQHVRQGVIRPHLALFRLGVRPLLHDVADGHQLGQRVLQVTIRVRATDSPHADDANLQCHVRISSCIPRPRASVWGAKPGKGSYYPTRPPPMQDRRDSRFSALTRGRGSVMHSRFSIIPAAPEADWGGLPT